ncbi:hypothetical protein [Lacihabitans soyangensis]|uniref:Uncharacterized protein n=1 Tax=Lacihabitans soyangensis TaxID=869394 RepID=A0AAE3H1C1_9BACT|nr:hypothetical protein [Lacihabitans soyangensis]MCP9763127.1 hypothetical protein [Lacihabitans soyangensis]
MSTQPLFKETQRFNHWWLWIPLVALLIYFIYLASSQFIQKLAEGDNRMIEMSLFIPSVFLFLILLLFWNIRLETSIGEEGIAVRLFPFHIQYKFLKWESISTAKIRKYKPLLEYGGWGLRYGFSGKAYNIKGNTGLQLQFKDTSKLMIGTQKSEELSAILKKLCPEKFQS